MDLIKKILALTLVIAFALSLCVSCKKELPEPILPEKEDKVFNVVYALATVPPVLAAIDCIDSGYETYAIVERGKTYSGIDKLEYFHNAGFDTASNESSGLSQEKLDAMTAKVKELNEANENAFFVFYAQDGTALSCAAIAANAGIPKENFHVYMCEDGTGAYVALKSSFIDGKTVNADTDEPYEAYSALAKEAENSFDGVMAKTDNNVADPVFAYNIKLAFAIASLPNFTYYLQDEATVKGILKGTGESTTLLLSAFGIDGYTGKGETEYKLNLKYQKISEGISKLSEEERTDYLVLMYGDYYEDTYSALTRTVRADKEAPKSKLVFIGARHSYYPVFASDPAYGIGGLGDGDTVPESYEKLDAKYKNALLFATENDYKLFLDVINKADSYTADATEDIKNKVKTAAFTLYINYIYTLKFTYLLYGENYDIILKGHPREVIGSASEWGGRYTVGYGEDKKYVFDTLLDSLLISFHSSDSIGKYIGTVPYGTAAENLAYLGADVSICGLPSSTYNGYDTDVDVLFIMAATDESIDGDASQVKERFLAGNLTFTDGDTDKHCVFYNTGNVYKYASKILKSVGDVASASAFDSLYEAWLTSARGGAKGTDDQGFALTDK